MQRIINNPTLVVEDMLKAFVNVHKDIVHVSEANERVIISNFAKNKKKVGIVTGGGSGHKPAFIGYCGLNMVDAVAVGEIFSSPTASSFVECIKEVDQGMGVACLYGNYAGDNMNVKLAMKAAEELNIKVKTVVANDDVASAGKEERNKRRGVAGEIFMWKAAAAKASLGYKLEEVIECAQKAIENTRSIGVGLSACTIPANGKPNFNIKEGFVEFGIGHHGEPGINIEELSSSKKMAKKMLDIIIDDLPFEKNDEVAIIVSGLGATPVMEQYIYYGDIKEELDRLGIKIYKAYVGNYFTSLEMNGITLSIMKLDQELKECIDLETKCMGLTQYG